MKYVISMGISHLVIPMCWYFYPMGITKWCWIILKYIRETYGKHMGSVEEVEIEINGTGETHWGKARFSHVELSCSAAHSSKFVKLRLHQLHHLGPLIEALFVPQHRPYQVKEWKTTTLSTSFHLKGLENTRSMFAEPVATDLVWFCDLYWW